MIEIQHVSKRYGARVALSNVSLTLNRGEVTLLLGANGAGKSTLLRCILGITGFDGVIAVDGLDPLRDGRAVRSHIGYMPQSGGLHPDLTVQETLRFYAELRRADVARCAVLMEEAGLTAHSATRVGDLSGGLRQRLGFAVALLTDPGILVLDEPSASLDSASRVWLANRLRTAAAEGRVVLVSTHAVQELLAAGDRQVVLEDGQVISDGATPRRGRSPTLPAEWPARRAQAGSLTPLVRKELSDAIGSRWLIAYAVLLGTLGFAAASTGIDSASGLALQAFGRTTATLMNLCLLLAPLVAVLMGAAAIAVERERGTLEHLLAQPVSRTGVLLAKHTGLLASLAAATALGFLPAGVLIASAAGPGVIGHYLMFPAIAVLVACALAAVGMLISVASRSAVQAQGAAVFAWFAFVLLYDLVLIGSLALSAMPVEALGVALLANPVDAARVLGVLSLEPDLYLLGPAGAFLTSQFGRGGAALLLVVALLFWAAAPLGLAVHRFAMLGPFRMRKAPTHAVALQPVRRPARCAAPDRSAMKEVTLS